MITIGILLCLFACGWVSAALALRDLDSHRRPRLGLLYRGYAAASNGWVNRSIGKGETDDQTGCSDTADRVGWVRPGA